MIQLRTDVLSQLTDVERDGNIVSNDLLDTAVAISLFTRRRAEQDDVLPEPNSDREGWWADGLGPNDPDGDKIGSRLWLLNRSKASQRVLNLAKTYAEEALAWLVEDGIASEVTVSVERAKARDYPELRTSGGGDMLVLGVRIVRPDDPAARWESVWAAHLGEL